MKLSQDQLRGRIKNLAQKNNADARILLRLYMIERFLEGVSISRYNDNFIIKGGVLVTSLINVALRSTMDIDTTIKNLNLSESDIQRTVKEICAIDLQDDVTFQIKQISHIMDEMEYPGIRITMNAYLNRMLIPMKIDISTGDIITPSEVQHQYKLLLEDRFISLWSYNLETLLSEKLQTVLARGTLNTRMRDFYDLYELTSIYKDKIDPLLLKSAFQATCTKRNSSQLLTDNSEIISMLQQNSHLRELWNSYQQKYSYAKDITYENILQCTQNLCEIISEESPY